MRLFAGLGLDPALATPLAALIDQLRARIEGRVRWVPAHNLHVTLRFYGDVAPDRVDALRADCARVAAATAPFELALTDLDAFSRRGRPWVLWLGVDPAGPTPLATALEAAAQAAGFDAEPRAYHPHVTLGRCRAGLDDADRAALTTPVELALRTQRVDGFTLFESRPDGPRGGSVTYVPLERWPLGG